MCSSLPSSSSHLVGWEDQFKTFVLGPKKSLLSDLVRVFQASRCHYRRSTVQDDHRPLSRSLIVHAMELLDQSCEKVFESLALDPQRTLETCDRILDELAKTLITATADLKDENLGLHFRVSAYPVAEYRRATVPKNEDVGVFLR